MQDSISKKQVTINMAANIVSYSANIIISFVLTPFLINTLGKETYGFYPIANTIVMYMSILTNAMNSMANRFVTVSLVQGEKDEADKYFSSTLAANLLLSGILLIPMVIVVVFLDQFMDVPINSEAAIKTLFGLVFASAIINISASVFGIATFAKNRIDLRSLRELITASIRLLLFLFLYTVLPPSIVYIGIVTIIVAAINIAFQYAYTRMLIPEIRLSKDNVSRKHTLELLSSSSWNAINSFGNILLAGTSMVLANLFYGAAASGSFSIVNTVPQFMNGVIVMLIGIFYPVITYKYAQNDKKGLIEEIKKSQCIVGIFGCSVIAVFSAFAEDFFSLWTPGENAHYLAIISFVTILPHYVISCMWSLTNLNVVMKKIKVPALFTLACGVVNVIVAYIVYKVAAPGLISLPLISSMLQIIWIGVFIPLYACKNLRIKWYTFYPTLIKALITAFAIFLCLNHIVPQLPIDSWIDFFVYGGICGLLALFVFSFILLKPRQMRRAFADIKKMKR